MAEVILYPSDDGGLAVVNPVPGTGLTTMQVALKDVPVGTPFLIVDSSELPADSEYRAAWEADFSEPDGYGVGSIDLAPE